MAWMNNDRTPKQVLNVTLKGKCTRERSILRQKQ